MGVQYFCRNKRRRQAIVDHAILNSIDYLEVLDRDALAEPPIDTPRQRTLLVRFLRVLPASLTGDNVRIDGGVRVTPVKVEWAGRASDAGDLFANGRITESERDFLLTQSEPDHLLVVRTNSEGDYSNYCLSLVTSPTDQSPPTDFDPILSRVEFSFKVECPSDFDCKIEPECPPEATAAPFIDYMSKDYASFRQLILDRLAIIMPGWQERNPSDIGIALVEVLAYAADYLSYFQDATATEAYLNTARRRISMRRHARLLDYYMHDGCNARVWVAFQIDAGGDGVYLPGINEVTGSPTRLLTQVPEGTVIPEDRLQEVLAAHRAEVFELMDDLRLYRAHNQIMFHTWGDEECCLPMGATRATLKDDTGERLRLRPGDVVIFEERHDPGTGEEKDSEPAHRHAVRLTQVYPEALEDGEGKRTPGPLVTDTLFEQPIVQIEWDAQDALPFPLCLSTVIDGSMLENVSVVLGNVALADHGQTISRENIDPPSGHRRYRPCLQETNITHRVPYRTQQDIRRPATTSIIQDPRKALPDVQLTGDGETWAPRRDLLNSDCFANEFVVEMEKDGRSFLRFGDGIYGRKPSARKQLQAEYRIGNGTAGNVGADAIGHVVTGVSGIIDVRNPLPAKGGTDPESMDEVRLYAPQAFRTQERAVTEEDYAKVTERHPEVQKAVAIRRWTGSWYTMFVTVDRKGGRPVSPVFEAKLRQFLERFRLAGHDLEIDGPRFVPLDIVLTVCVAHGFFRSDVKQALLKTFSNQDLPDRRRGLFHPDNFTFGQPVYLSQIIAKAMAVPGVQWVDVDDSGDKPNRFRRWGEPAHGEIDKGMIEIARLEIARLDNDPSLPENGKIDFIMEGGL
jgi:hypothetical protein